jgi:hypothetical protein
VDARHRLSKVSQGSVISVICTRQATGHQDVCARDRLTRGAVLHAQRPSDSLCQRTLGLNPGLLRLRHWPSDALTTQLDLMQCVMLPCPMSGIVQTWMSQIIPYLTCQRQGPAQQGVTKFRNTRPRQAQGHPFVASTVYLSSVHACGVVLSYIASLASRSTGIAPYGTDKCHSLIKMSSVIKQ